MEVAAVDIEIAHLAERKHVSVSVDVEVATGFIGFVVDLVIQLTLLFSIISFSVLT